MGRAPIVAFAVLLVACSGEPGAPALDGGGEPDAQDTASTVDAVDTGDALVVMDAMDAWPGVDAAVDTGPDLVTTGPACTYGGLSGSCIDYQACPGESIALGTCSHGDRRCCLVEFDAGWCPYNGMAQPNAGLTEEPGQNGCPAGMVRVSSYCVDRFEASLEVVNADGTTAPWSPFWHPDPALQYRAVSLRGGQPQGYINGVEAGAACTNAGKRLCTDTEWLRACQGSTGTTYPYGNTRMPGVCNDGRAEHPAISCFHTSASWIWSEIGYAGINQQPDTVDPAGSRSGCVTQEGAYDMMGNLHEWTADPAGTFRGGYYMDTVMNGPGCLYVTTAHDTSHWDYSTGFRCCADAM